MCNGQKFDSDLRDTIHDYYINHFAFIFGLILGVLLFLSAKSNSVGARIFYSIVSFVVNLFRAIPFIILILLLIPFTSIVLGTISGPTGALPALIIGASPFYARLVEIAFKEIDKGVIEASVSMGATTLTSKKGITS